MNRIILTAIAAMFPLSMLFAQTSDEFQTLSVWLSKYYCEQNNVEWVSTDDPRYEDMKASGQGMFSLPPLTLQSDMYNKIKQEFPMDPSLQSAITAIENQRNADRLALAQKYGYSSYNDLMNNVKTDPALRNVNISGETQKIDSNYYTAYSDATKAYSAEFQKRYETAVIEAIKRIQENAKAMNPAQK